MKPENFFSRRNPVSKGVFSLALLVAGLFAPFPLGFGLLGVMLCIAVWAGCFRAFFTVFFRSLFVLSVLIVVMRGFFTGGVTVLFSFWIFDFTVEGVVAGAKMAQILILAGSSILLFFNMTDIQRFMVALEGKGVSPRTTFVVLSSFQMITELSRMSALIMEAQQARGIETEGTLWTRVKAYIPIIGPLIISSIAHIEERVITLEARGFSAPVAKTRIQTVDENRTDHLLGWIGVLLALSTVAWRVSSWV